MQPTTSIRKNALLTNSRKGERNFKVVDELQGVFASRSQVGSLTSEDVDGKANSYPETSIPTLNIRSLSTSFPSAEAYLKSVRKRLNVQDSPPVSYRGRSSKSESEDSESLAPRSTNELINQYSKKIKQNQSQPNTPELTPKERTHPIKDISTDLTHEKNDSSVFLRELPPIPVYPPPSLPRAIQSLKAKEYPIGHSKTSVDLLSKRRQSFVGQKERKLRSAVSLSDLLNGRNSRGRGDIKEVTFSRNSGERRSASPPSRDNIIGIRKSKQYRWIQKVAQDKSIAGEDFNQLFPRASRKMSQKITNNVNSNERPVIIMKEKKRPRSLPRPKSRGFFDEIQKRYSEGLFKIIKEKTKNHPLEKFM